MRRPLASFALFARLHGELDRLFEEALGIEGESEAAGRWLPKVDVIESERTLRLQVEIPGVDVSDLVVEVSGDRVAIRGAKRPQRPPAGAHFHCAEREHGTFAREVRIHCAVNSHQGRARLEDGVLTIEFPRIEDQRRDPVRLEVERRSKNRPGGGE